MAYNEGYEVGYSSLLVFDLTGTGASTLAGVTSGGIGSSVPYGGIENVICDLLGPVAICDLYGPACVGSITT